MFDVISGLLWMTFAINFGASPTIQKEVEQKQVAVVVEMQTEQEQNSILSKDFKVAKQALDKAVSERDEATIRLGLSKGSPSFRKDIIQAIKNRYYQSLVPDLIIALENQDSMSAEADNIIVRRELKKAIVSALIHLTGLRFPNTEELSKIDIQKILEESREWYRANEPEIQQALAAEMLERRQETPILSRNYHVAKWAFDKAVLEKDKLTIQLGLKGFSLLIKRDVVQAIKQLEDKSFIPDLIKALADNQSGMSGGLETQSEQQELNKEIISALKQLTGLDFPYLNDSSTIPCFKDCPSKAMERVLKESQEWWKIYQRKNNLQDSKNN